MTAVTHPTPAAPSALLVAGLVGLLALPAAAEPMGPELVLLDLINAERDARGLRPVFWDEDLARLARDHAHDMRRRGIASHHSSGDDAVFADRLARTDLVVRTFAENTALARGLLEAHAALMDSPGHRANILSDEVTDVGIGVSVTDDGGAFFVVEDFASVVRPLPDGEAILVLRDALLDVPRSASSELLVERPDLSREAARLARRMAELDAERSPGLPAVEHDFSYHYTTIDPATLPISLTEILATTREYGVGLTRRQTPSRPAGTYFVVFVLRGVG